MKKYKRKYFSPVKEFRNYYLNLYISNLSEQKEMSWMEWQKSEYKNIKAHDNYIKFYNLIMKVKYENKA